MARQVESLAVESKKKKEDARVLLLRLHSAEGI